MIEACFTLYGEIKTKARPRARIYNEKYAVIYTPKNTVNYENLIKLEYLNQTGKLYFGDKPLEVTIEANFKLPKSDMNIRKYYSNEKVLCVNHKDLDNIAKTILDALNKVAYDDDKQVCKLTVSKFYIFEGCEYVKVKIKELFGTVRDIRNNKHQLKLNVNKFSNSF